MNPNEAVWFARAIRLMGVKALFDAVINVFNWLLQYRSTVVIDAQLKSYPRRELFWASLSLAIGTVLLRFAPEISLALVGKRGARKISCSLSDASSAWLSIGVRCMAFFALVRSPWYWVNGFLTAVTESRLGGDVLGRTSFHYFIWGIVYASTGAAFSLRPDIIGIFLPAKETLPPGSATPEGDATPPGAAHF